MKDRPYQSECLNLMNGYSSGRYLVNMATGLGKCFAKDTEILMYDGEIKKVQDIKKDDLLMGWDNKPRKIISTTTGIEQMYEVKQNKKDSYIVNESHILSLKCTNIGDKHVTDINGNKYKSYDICNITVKDYLQCCRTFKHVMKGFSTDLIEFDEKPLIIDPYFLGLWLGDGSANSLSITTPDIEVVDYLNNFAIDNYFNIRIEDLKNNKAKTYYLTRNWCRNNFTNYFKDNLKNNKHIPHEYKINSKENRLQLLAGLLDSDGYLATTDNSTFELITKYNHIANDIAFICRSLGLSCVTSIKYNKKYDKNYYRCSIYGKTSIIPTKIKRKQAKNNRNKDNKVYKIDIIKNKIDNYYGFEIIGPDRMFLLSDFTVVHNTYVFDKYINELDEAKKILILSHREELVFQPLKYLNCSYGIEMAKHTSNGEKVVSACVPTMVKRLDKFPSDYFDVIITDECHHASAESYQKIYDHFTPKLHFGFTATPNRADNVRLDSTFDDIIFEKDLKWGIQNGYLSDITCRRFYINYDLSKCKSFKGDYQIKDLDKLLNTAENAQAIAKIYHENAIGSTLIFGVSVTHCEEIGKYIPGSMVITAKTKNRSEIIEKFTAGKIKCLINCMIFTEGTDVPRVETVIIARPTKNVSLYTQMVGRGLRLFPPDKKKLLLIDCAGVSNLNLCTAPTLLGIDYKPKNQEIMTRDDLIEGDLFDLPDKIAKYQDQPDYWRYNWKEVNLWAKDRDYQLHDVNYYKHPNGDLTLNFKKVKIRIPAPNELGNINYNNKVWKAQKLYDAIYTKLNNKYKDDKMIWDFNIVSRWGRKTISEKQANTIRKMLPRYDLTGMTMLEASQILNRLFNK